MEQQVENPKKSFVVIACVLLAILSLIPGWGLIAFLAVILAVVILKSGRFTSNDKKMAFYAIVLAVIAIALLSLRTYFYIKSDVQSRQEYAYTAEDVKEEMFYPDQRCNVGVSLRDGLYEGSDYPCNGKIFERVRFQVLGNFIAMGDLNHDDRNDAVIVLAKQYGEEEEIIEIAGFVNSILFGADKRQLVFNGSEELSNASRVEGLKIESGIIVLNFVVCCPTQEKVGTYVIDEVYRTLKPIQSSDVSSWQTYRNEEFGFEMKLPTGVLPKEYEDSAYYPRTDSPLPVVGIDTSLDQESSLPTNPPRGEITVDVEDSPILLQNCLKYEGASSDKFEEVNGIMFTVFSVSSGGMGGQQNGKSYHVIHNSTCYILQSLVSWKYIRFYHGATDLKPVTEQELQEEEKLVQTQADFNSQILSTFKFLR